MGFDQLVVVGGCLIIGIILEMFRTGREVRSFKEQLILSTIKSETAREIAAHALKHSTEAMIKIGALEKSTHTIYPVEAKGNMMEELLGRQLHRQDDLEKKLQEATGLPDEDFESDLAAQGFDNDPSMDDLV